MTYTTIQRRYPRRRPALAGFFEDLEDFLETASGGSQQQQCINQANRDVAAVDAKIDDLVRNWTPTGFYTSKDIRDLVSSTMKVVAQARTLLDQAAAEPNASQASIMRASNDLSRAGARSLDYLDAAAAADQQGLRVINAPGLKRWVTDTMATASSTVVTSSVIACIRPWWVGALAGFQSAFDVAWGITKRVAGAALAIGETALKVLDDLPQLYTILKWGLVVGGAYWAWIQLSNLKSSGRTVL